jgi:NTE family protein
MIGLALSGGGSRAMAFHLGCLRALNDLGILNRVSVLSTISGGSVIGAYYAYTPQLSFAKFEFNVREILKEGFHSAIWAELFKPWNLIQSTVASVRAHVEEITYFVRKKEPECSRYPCRTDMFHRVLKRDLFPDIRMDSPRRGNLEVVIGACELRTGSAFRFGNDRAGSWRLGELVDNSGHDVALAVAASAAFPLLLPSLDRTWLFRKDGREQERRVILTDGGVYDNLGLQVLEPGRDKSVSLHTFPCEYLIACNAGHGQDGGDCIPLGIARRIVRTFDVVHRRVQDSTMNRLHHLQESRLIKGFILPYLGQQDDRLPFRPTEFIRREEVITYGTDFAPMPPHWIEKLSGRGEQLTRTLVSQYLGSLL